MTESIAGKDHPFVSTSQFGRRPPIKPYSIFDTPDNEKTAEKTKVMAVRGIGVGSYVAVCEMIAFSKPTTPLTILARYSTVCFPLAAMAVSYPAVVCMTANARKKDGPFNHFVGGFVSGTMLGTRMKSQKAAWGFGFAFGLLGVFCKYISIEGIELTADRTYKSAGSFNHYRHTFIPGMKHRQLEATDTLDEKGIPH